MSMLICNCVYERLANNGKITTFTGVPFFDAFVRNFGLVPTVQKFNPPANFFYNSNTAGSRR